MARRQRLGVITQVALKLRPLPKTARTLVTREGGIGLAARGNDVNAILRTLT
jgi:FAD/FMN-containing dehydrogenase